MLIRIKSGREDRREQTAMRRGEDSRAGAMVFSRNREFKHRRIISDCRWVLFAENKPADQQDEGQGNHQTLDPSSEPLTFPMLIFADGVFVVLNFRKMIPVHSNNKT